MPKFCSQPYDTVSIRNDGNIFPCLCGDWNFIGKIGNLLQQSLSDIFQSSSISKLRDSVVDQNFQYCNPNICGEFWSLSEIDTIPIIQPILPTNIMLSIDANCNLQCRSCRNFSIYNKNIDINADKIMQGLINSYQDFTKPVFIYCDGAGDIFVSEAYKKFFTDPKLPKCFKFVLTTNGNLLLKNVDILEKIRNQIDSIIVSLDSSNVQTYKKVRGGDFNLVLNGIKCAIQLGIEVSAQFVVQKNNYEELLAYRDLCKTLKINTVGYQLIKKWSHMENIWWDQNKILDNPTVNIQTLYEALLELSKDSNIIMCGGLQSILKEDLRYGSTSVVQPPTSHAIKLI